MWLNGSDEKKMFLRMIKDQFKYPKITSSQQYQVSKIKMQNL